MDLKLLKKNGIIIIHRHKKEKDNFPIKFNILLDYLNLEKNFESFLNWILDLRKKLIILN